jgi:hypothetical protein
MIASEPAVTVHEVSMQEWAMLAFHAERAPRRPRVTVNTAKDADDCATGSLRRGFWFLLAVAVAGTVWWLI